MNLPVNAEHIDPELLPQTLRELVDIVGLEGALKLAEAYPGVAVYIPSRCHADHPLAKLIGLINLKKLADVYGREHLRIPKLDAAMRQIKHRLVRDLRSQNISNRVIALQVGYTQRRVEQLNSETDTDTPQTDLFE